MYEWNFQLNGSAGQAVNNTSQIKILLVEGKRGNHIPFGKDLEKKGYQVFYARNGAASLECLSEQDFDVIVVDAASLRTNGTRICSDLKNIKPQIPIILIVSPTTRLNGDNEARAVLTLPFTVQKLVNRIKNFYPEIPKYMLIAGPIQLNLQTNYLSCNGREAQATPRASELLKILIENRGSIIDRETLFTNVWDTQYLGDTRSLDVHISWLRKVIEDDPRHPKLLVTIRGVGYKLNI